LQFSIKREFCSVKSLKRVAALLGVILPAFAAAPSYAANSGAAGHVSISVTSVLGITEVAPLSFGNFAVTCANSVCDRQSSIVLDSDGTRTVSSAGADTIVLLNQAAGAGGVTSGTPQETGSQRPGFYSINAGGEGSGAQNVYISFADVNGNVIDKNHPHNHVALSGPVANAFIMDTFTFESDTGTTGYVQQTPSQTDIYGSYIPLVNGRANIRVGATLRTAAVTTPPAGQYSGTFNVMASY
jgi:hypothetical protein